MENYISRFLGVKAVSILNQWLIDNKNYPYPDESTTDYLAQQAGNNKNYSLFSFLQNFHNFLILNKEISSKQVKKWFANKRVRSQLCCKTIHRNKRVNIYSNYFCIFPFFTKVLKANFFFKEIQRRLKLRIQLQQRRGFNKSWRRGK
jgi:hypothetical protein